MNNDIILTTSQQLKIKPNQVKTVLELLANGNTIPFIARYRKEATNALDEEQIRAINDIYQYQLSLVKRQEDVIRLIEEKGLLTEDLKQQILQTTKLIEVEDIYRPFKEKKKTKATSAINNGLEPLAKKIMTFPDNIELIAKEYLNEQVPTIELVLEGAKDIIAEWISDNAIYRKWIRNYTYNNGILTTKAKKNHNDDTNIYEMYYDYQEKVSVIKPHRILAVNRAEKEKIITVNIEIPTDEIINYLTSKIMTKPNEIVYSALVDSYKRLIKPSIERELRSELTDKAEISAINNFSQNLEKLLLQQPMKAKTVLGFDPAYRTGCKLAVVDPTGELLEVQVIYPHEPQNQKQQSEKVVLDLIDKYKIDIVAIGNGTAGRESEQFIADIIKKANHIVSYVIVSEAGASVYSASKLAIEEFPKLHVEQRSAISIARRLQDPLAELVKIDPESIGIGLYQHDIANNKLTESLDFVVSTVVNKVGVNLNTASASLLKYVSGITKKSIDKIIEYRKKGKIMSRKELKKVLSDKTYEQAIGFLRINDGTNILDVTDIHPESYDVALNLLQEFNLDTKDIGKTILTELDIDLLVDKLQTDKYTLMGIVESLQKPNRDPRDNMPQPLLRKDVLKLEDLQVGMKLQGTVRNVVDFGAFIDIGLKNDGLAHISKLSNNYINNPRDILSVGEIVDCYVDEIFLTKQKVALSLLER